MPEDLPDATESRNHRAAERYRHLRGRARDLGLAEKIIVWLLAVVCTLVLALVALIAPFHSAFLDICDAIHESPNNPHGWTAACISMAFTLTAARWLKSRQLLVAAYGLLVPQWLLWYWLLVNPFSSC